MLFVDEARALLSGDDGQLLRERLGRLSSEQREALREALAA